MLIVHPVVQQAVKSLSCKVLGAVQLILDSNECFRWEAHLYLYLENFEVSLLPMPGTCVDTKSSKMDSEISDWIPIPMASTAIALSE